MFGVFLAYYLAHDHFPGATPLQFAFVGGLSFSVGSYIATILLIGKEVSDVFSSFYRISTRHNTLAQSRPTSDCHHWWAVYIVRPPFCPITILSKYSLTNAHSGAYVAASFSKTIWQLILSQGVCYGVGMGICYTATAGLIAKWFKKQRALANGIATGGTGFGGLTYSLAANAMIQRMGIAWTFRIMAIICFVVLITSALFLKDPSKGAKAPLTAFDRDLFKMLDFWLFLGWGWLSSFGYVAVVFSLSAYAQQVGFSAQQGSLVSAMFNRE